MIILIILPGYEQDQINNFHGQSWPQTSKHNLLLSRK